VLEALGAADLLDGLLALVEGPLPLDGRGPTGGGPDRSTMVRPESDEADGRADALDPGHCSRRCVLGAHRLKSPPPTPTMAATHRIRLVWHRPRARKQAHSLLPVPITRRLPISCRFRSKFQANPTAEPADG